MFSHPISHRRAIAPPMSDAVATLGTIENGPDPRASTSCIRANGTSPCLT